MSKKTATLVLAFLTLIGFSCKKGPTTAYRAKIISNGCGVVIADVEGNNGVGTPYNLGSVTYNNAVVINDYCYLMDKNVKVGNTIDFNITSTKTAVASECATPLCVTFIALSFPGKSIYVNDVVVVNQ